MTHFEEQFARVFGSFNRTDSGFCYADQWPEEDYYAARFEDETATGRALAEIADLYGEGYGKTEEGADHVFSILSDGGMWVEGDLEQVLDYGVQLVADDGVSPTEPDDYDTMDAVDRIKLAAARWRALVGEVIQDAEEGSYGFEPASVECLRGIKHSIKAIQNAVSTIEKIEAARD